MSDAEQMPAQSENLNVGGPTRLNQARYELIERLSSTMFAGAEMGDPSIEITPEDLGGIVNDTIVTLAQSGLLNKEACEQILETEAVTHE
jgi:hypothetical protein